MGRTIATIALLVPDYDAGIDFYVGQLGFALVEDSDLGGGKRWVRVCPDGAGPCLLLAKAANDEQAAAIGRQAGGRVGFFLETDEFETDHAEMVLAGVEFLEEPRREPYGRVAVFRDPFGNKWDLIEPAG